jgi:rubrerythrin
MKTKMRQAVLYQCNLCNYVLKPKEEDPAPSYCPNCALYNHKGKMVPVSVTEECDDGSIKENV